MPTENPIDLIQLCTIHIRKESNEIHFYIEIPLVSRDSFKLFEIIPILFKENNKTKILNINSFQYLQNDNIYKTIDSQLVNKCKKAMNMSLCDLLTKTKMQEPKNCELSLIYNSECEHIDHKEIDTENYIMYTSATSIYVSTLKPMNLYVSCIDSIIKYEISQDSKFIYDEHCEIFTINTSQNLINSSLLEIDLTWKSPNF